MQPVRLQYAVWLPRGPAEVFEFFSDARNLQALTPAWLNFSILAPEPIRLSAGTLIDYLLKVRGFPVKWQTEITVWEPPHRFIDVQRRGPYRLWVHEHTFQGRDGGTLAGDTVRYVPCGGRLIDWLFVRRDVQAIFAYRQEKLRSLFGP